MSDFGRAKNSILWELQKKMSDANMSLLTVEKYIELYC